MKAQDVIDFVFDIAPNPDWSTENVFEFGDASVDVTGVGVAWWMTSRMLEDLAAKGHRLALSHERVIYDLPPSYHWGPVIATDELEANRRIAGLCERHGLAVHRFHSNIDVADFGMPRALIERLGWSDYPCDWSRSVPVVTVPEAPLRELADELKRKLELPFVRYDGDPARPVRRVAVAWGGLLQGWAAAGCVAPLGIDCLVGGDVIDGVVRLAREQGWAVIDAMHHATEMDGMRALAERIRKQFPSLAVEFCPNTVPWAVA